MPTRVSVSLQGQGSVPRGGGCIPCDVADDQVGTLVEAIELGPRWLEETLAIISLKDEVDRIRKQRQATHEKLRRMAKAYIDGIFPDEEYHRQKRLLETELASLVVPAANAAEEVGRLNMNLKELWAKANLAERRKLLLSMLDGVYFETKRTRALVAVRPKPPFRPIFQVAASKQGSCICIISEPYLGSPVFLVEAGETRTRCPPHCAGVLFRSGTCMWVEAEVASLLRERVARAGLAEEYQR